MSISSNRVLIDGVLKPATIYVEDGKIAKITTLIDPDSKSYGDLCIIPGLVDAHVHLNEPGRTEWEGFETGTKAAASGGVTTVIDMPLNAIPPTTTVPNFELKLKAAENQCWVDVGFWGGLVPDNIDDLVPLLDRGVRGFKGFLIESGVDEFPMVTPKDILKAAEALKDTPAVLMFHAEMDCGSCSNPSGSKDPRTYSTFLDSRPDKWEVDAVQSVCDVGREYKNSPLKFHVVHLGSGQAVPVVEKAQKEDVKITAETCFHYLTLSSEKVPDGNTLYKCCPPIRNTDNQRSLWEAIKKNIITTVVSDHSPCTPDLKQLDIGDFNKAWGGITSLGLGLTLLTTFSDLSLPRISELTSLNTANQAGLKHKGKIAVGYDADFCIFDPDFVWTINQANTEFKNKFTPYNKLQVKGKVVQTILRGNTVYENSHVSETPLGQLITTKREF